jgi:hypothetical protein
MCTLSALVMAVTAPSSMPSVPAQSPLPVQQIPRSTSARIEDNQGRLAAMGALVRYSTNQAYFILQHVDSSLADKAVTVYTPDEESPLNLRINSIQDTLPDRKFLPVYVQVHWNADERLVIEHLIDNLAEDTLGRQNLELKKNVTIDLFDSDGDAYLRDNAGFIITDRLQLHQITVDAQQMLRALKPDPNVRVEEITEQKGREELLAYDGQLSAHNRTEFLEFLYSKSKVYIARWKTDKARPDRSLEDESSSGNSDSSASASLVAGYICTSRIDQRVLCLYAESEAVAEALIGHHLKQSRAKHAIFCSSRNHWSKLHSLGSFKSRVIYRRHTRAVPSNIKWQRIFAINVGMNLF